MYIVTIRTSIVGCIYFSSLSGKYELFYDMVPDKKSAYIGSLMIDIFTNRMFEKHKDIDEIWLNIKQNNKLEKVIAARSGYTRNRTTKYIRKNKQYIKDNN